MAVFTGASAVAALGASSAQAAPAAPGDKYVPIAEKGSPSGVAALDSGAKILPSQLPDLSATILAVGRGTFASKDSLSWNVKDFGAKGDFRTISDANITTNQLSSPTYSFTAQDVGKRFTVYNSAEGRGLNMNHINGTILSVSGGVATLSASAAAPRAGVRADWASDDRAAIQSAIDAAMADDNMSSDGIAREIVFDPSVSTWWVGAPLIIGTNVAPGSPVTLRGGGATGSEIGGTSLKNRGLVGQTIIQKADSKAGHDIIQHYGNGLALENLCLDGRMAAGYCLKVDFSFELRLTRCRFIRSYTTALKLQTCNNGQADDIHVNYAGQGRAWPAVKVTSTRNADASLSPSNTFHWNNIHIEYNSGVDLDIASGATDDEYAEYHKFNQLHIEATIANFYNVSGGSVKAKNVPSLVLGNVRSVNFVNSMLYAKGQPAVEIKAQADIAGVEYGVNFVGCEFLGVTGVDRLVDVISLRNGSASFIGCKFSGADQKFVLIDAAYAGTFTMAGAVFGENIAPVPAAGRVVDNRATLNPNYFENLITDRDAGVTGTGHFVARTPATNQRPTIAGGSGLGTGAATPTISGSDSAGQVSFATGTTPTADNIYFAVTFRKAYVGAARVFLAPANSATAKLGQPYIGANGSGWAVYFPTALAGGLTGLQYNYFVIGSAT
ncbi:hypothetical protein [Arthrobacter oryzae]|uniref:hypothetical protein n=1 Tax=Arthrobacter oryzae TaxID=409290 RepID=UPI00286256E8|nr:hypothetical protein [Arthrobacter oryzae]MDR6505118.1 hypothetical protein [Arthrobacter oryzae]